LFHEYSFRLISFTNKEAGWCLFVKISGQNERLQNFEKAINRSQQPSHKLKYLDKIQGSMNLNNPVIKLCLAGTQAELQGKIDEARSLYQNAWEAAQDDYDACIAAHYVARHQANDREKLYWNQVALDKANAVTDGSVQEFYLSLFLNMGQSYERLGNGKEAKRYYDLAAVRKRLWR
jgi:tetratricopeptide (TPR) repeat protein